MKSLRFDRRMGYLLAAFTFLVAAVSPGLLTATVHADVLQNRSIQLGTAAPGDGTATTTYKVQFTVAKDAAAVIIDFCSDSPLLGAACTAPTGLDTTSVSTPDGSTTVSAMTGTATSGKSIVKIVKAIDHTANSGVVDINLADMKNPTSAGTFYARILTFDTSGHADSYDDTTPGSGVQDSGAVALSISNVIGVQAAVLESMTFCVSGYNSGTPIGANCGSNITTPTLELGELSGSVRALSASAVSKAKVSTQISTNAAHGAVIRMKSSATGCGGLVRSGGGSNTCAIAPTASDVTQGSALFGVKLGTPYGTSGVTEATGTLQAATSSVYDTTHYRMAYNSTDESTGVTSPYGDDFLDTDGDPINNQNMDLEFGASISPNTPAGLYTADISLIAAGKF